MAQGYAKIEGKPMAMICHGVVGLQHATMAMYNAWCDRVPVIVFGGNMIEANKRAPGAEWVHSAIDPGALCRDFTKWDDQPTSLQHFAESCSPRLQDRDDPADGAGAALARRRVAGKPDHGRGDTAHPAARCGGAAAGRYRRARRARQDAGRCREPGPHRRPRRAHAGRHAAARRTRRDPAMRGDRRGRAHELPVAPPAQPELPPRHHRPGRCDPGDGDERSLGRAQQLPRSHRAHVAPELQERRQDRHARQPRSVPKGELSGLRRVTRRSISPSPATARRPCRR